MSFDFEFFAEGLDRRVDMGSGDQRAQTFDIRDLPAQLLDQVSGSFFLAQLNSLQRVGEYSTRVQNLGPGVATAPALRSAYR